MKRFATLAALSFAAVLVGCSSTQNTSAPGAVEGKKSECCAAKSGCTATTSAPGAVSSEKSGCCAAKSECSTKSAPGAVSGCSAKTECASKCPASK
ncbi:MAG: hypothetical protein ACO3QC_00610 [Phycisphaerales bacterium]